MRADLLLALRGGRVNAPASDTWSTQILTAQNSAAPTQVAAPVTQTTLTQTGTTPAVAPPKKNNTVFIVLSILLLTLAGAGLIWALWSAIVRVR